MRTRLFIIALVATLSTAFSASAQDYRTAVGLRLGSTNGITIKHFTKRNVALEGIVSTRWRGVGLTGLIEGHTRFLGINRLNFIYGAGAHVYIWGEGNRGYAPYQRSSIAGLDAILGLEYNFREVPINIGIDWKPTLNFSVDNGFWGDEAAISIRYTF
ncbi:MAG TPA: hypothetical protein DCR35_04625 [Runella sp.]|nr:hypothetical protein [Runella sp.]HAO48634.1 hypothetical protein [Runella sp.]